MSSPEPSALHHVGSLSEGWEAGPGSLESYLGVKPA